MPLLKSRVPFTPQNPYRVVRPKTSKIIFLSCEGSVTEEEYFGLISDIYSGIKSKIQFISVAEDVVFTAPKCRTQEQVRMLSKVRPKHLVERIDQFKAEKDDIYQFEEYPEDEFWILTDVDQNWSSQVIDPQNAKTYKDEWDDAIAACDEKGYHYAVSNPFLRYGCYCITTSLLKKIKVLLYLIAILMKKQVTSVQDCQNLARL